MKIKKLFILLLVCVLCNNKVFSMEEKTIWEGYWNIKDQTNKSLFPDIPFHSEYFNNSIIIYNEKPDRFITYEILDEYGNVFVTGSVSKENSAQITILVSDLPNNGIYTIILTSLNPNDRVWSQFER